MPSETTSLDHAMAARQAAFPHPVGTRLVYWVQNDATGRWTSGAIRGVYEELTDESRLHQRAHLYIGDVGECVIRFCDERWQPLPQYERLHLHEPDAEMLGRWRPECQPPKG